MGLVNRQRVLAGLFALTALVTLFLLREVIETVFFAITVAYVLHPVRQRLSARGLPGRLAAAGATIVGFVFVVVLLSPIAYVLYRRREQMIAFLESIPAEQPVTLFGREFVIDVTSALERIESGVVSAAVDLASAAPVLALKLFLFVLLVYAMLLRPSAMRSAAQRLVPREYHDILAALHDRVRNTLFALYVLQAATAVGTFLVAFVVFWALGYNTAFSLAVLAGILQFIPIIGPSLLVAALAAIDVVAGNTTAAILVVVFGLVFVGFLPDAVIRPQLASITTGMPASLYFIGFVGGTLSLGVVGVIAGPLVIALLVEVVELIVDERGTVQQTLVGQPLMDDDD